MVKKKSAYAKWNARESKKPNRHIEIRPHLWDLQVVYHMDLLKDDDTWVVFDPLVAVAIEKLMLSWNYIEVTVKTSLTIPCKCSWCGNKFNYSSFCVNKACKSYTHRMNCTIAHGQPNCDCMSKELYAELANHPDLDQRT